MQALPFVHQGIVAIHQKRVIELLAKLLLQRPKTGEIDHEPAGIQLGGGKPEGETAAVTVHEAAVARMAPLAMAAGIALKLFAAAEPGWWEMHGGRQSETSRTLREDQGCACDSEADAAPQPCLHRSTPF